MSDVEMEGLLSVSVANGPNLMIYAKPDHTPASFTVLNFAVSDVEAAVDQLVAQGVEMLRYDGFGQDEKGIATQEGPAIAWFKDPAGNVLSVVEDVM